MTGFVNLTGVLVRGIIIFIALKVVVAEQGKVSVRIMAYAILCSLLVMTARGYLG